jgi:Protein of unknown function (DUF1566)
VEQIIRGRVKVLFALITALVLTGLAHQSLSAGEVEQSSSKASNDAQAGKKIDSNAETWVDASTGLMWQKVPLDKKKTWRKAVDNCETLNLAGFRDWRLPTIGELRSLIRGCSATRTGGTCQVTDENRKHSLSWSKHCYGCKNKKGPGPGGAYWPNELSGKVKAYWSSSMVSDADTQQWIIYFQGAGFSAVAGLYSIPPRRAYVRCVR